MAIWYILWSFGIFFPLLVFWTKKNLATLEVIVVCHTFFSPLPPKPFSNHPFASTTLLTGDTAVSCPQKLVFITDLIFQHFGSI
jgi:hypothetical protein